MQYFKTYTDADGCIYSLDMLRLNVDFGESVKEFVKYLNTFSAIELHADVDYYPSYKQYKYRHLWSISEVDSDASWTIGLDLGRNADDKSKGFIEFNPNKCESSALFQKFMSEFRSCALDREVVRYDMAIDIPLPRNLCRLIRSNKKKYRCDVDESITEYLGRKNTSGYIKLYDKTAEAKLNYPLTRLEITLDKGVKAADSFPTVWVNNAQRSMTLDDEYFKLSGTQQVLADVIRESDTPNKYWQRLDGHTRKKIEPYVRDKTLNLDAKCASQIAMLAASYEA